MSLRKKIENKISERKGVTLIAILIAALAFGLIAFPIVRWVMFMSQALGMKESRLTAMGRQLEMQAVLEDRWSVINDMSVAQIKAATTKTTTYGKYLVKEEYATAGKYNASTGACASGTPSGTEQLCRGVTLTVTDSTNTTSNGIMVSAPVVATRVVVPSSRLASLEERLNTARNNFANYSTTAQLNSTLANYYTTAQLNSTLASYATTASLSNYYTKSQTYSKSEVDSRDTTVTTNINNTFASYYTKPQFDDKIKGFSTSNTESFEDSGGYYVFQNGMIMQWGYLPNISFRRQLYTVTFKKPFPHKCVTVLTSTFQPDYQSGIRLAYVNATSKTNAQLTTNGGGGSGCGIYWYALGY